MITETPTHPFKQAPAIRDEIRAKLYILQHDNARGSYHFYMNSKFEIIKSFDSSEHDVPVELLQELGYELVWVRPASREYLTLEILQSYGGIFGLDVNGRLIIDTDVDTLIEETFFGHEKVEA